MADNPCPRHPVVSAEHFLEPLVVRPRAAWRLLDCGNAYGYRLIASGELDIPTATDARERSPSNQSADTSSVNSMAAANQMGTTQKFVATASIRDAVAGQEPKILKALGILWTGSPAHIRCPYRDHIDVHPSWRWDARKKRAYCTCAQSNSIFDVISKIRGVDFEAAKIIAAEIIDRPDLIRQIYKKESRAKKNAQIPDNNTAPTENPGGCTLAAYAEAKQLNADTLRSFGVSQIYLGQPAVHIPYYAADGEEIAVRLRIALDGKNKFRWQKGDKAQLYGLDRIDAARKHGEAVIVEGESDCHTLWQAGSPAIGLPGAGNWNEGRDAALFDDIATIYVVIEPDAGGRTTLTWLSKSKIRDRVKLVRLNGFKDPSALYLNDPDRFIERWEAALKAARPWREEAEGKVEAGADAEAKASHDQEREKQADVIVKLARAKATFFHAPDGAAFADVRVEKHRETWSVRSRKFKLWLTKLYYEEVRSAPNSDAAQCALNVLEAIARFDGVECDVWVRKSPTKTGKSI